MVRVALGIGLRATYDVEFVRAGREMALAAGGEGGWLVEEKFQCGTTSLVLEP